MRWRGDHGLPTSLSIINDRVSSQLAGRVQRVNRDDTEVPGPPLVHTADVEVRHQWPPDLRPAPAGRLAVIQPWEFGAIPTDWLDPIARNVDELWVPSDYVRAMYLEAGVDPDRVVTIPNGVDLEVFTPDGPERALPDAGEGTRFLFVGGLIGRKGADVLFDAWLTAFADRDDVTLVLKDFGADGIYRAPAASRSVSTSPPVRCPHRPDRRRALHRGAGSLYRACDVLVHPYRGEGFAMPVLEAMACGLPVIVTNGGPTDDSSLPTRAGASPPRGHGFPNIALTRSRPTAARGCSSPTADTWWGSCVRPMPRTMTNSRPEVSRGAPRRSATPGTPLELCTRTASPR